MKAVITALRRTRRRGLLSIVAVALVLALAACGGSSSTKKVSAASYVKSVCTSATSWFHSIQTAGGQLQATVHKSHSLPSLKKAYISFVEDMLNATARAEQQLRSAGTPSVKNGNKISAEVVHAFENARRGLQRAAAQVREAPTSSSSAFESAAGGVQGTVQRALSSMAALAPQKNPQLHAAALKDPSCKRLRSIG